MLRQLQIDWQSSRLLESLTDQLSQRFVLRSTLTIALGECGQANAFYRSDTKTVVMCLDLMGDMVRRIVQEHGGTGTRDAMIATLSGALVFVTLHEIGHALIDIQGAPILGREEDVAD